MKKINLLISAVFISLTLTACAAQTVDPGVSLIDENYTSDMYGGSLSGYSSEENFQSFSSSADVLLESIRSTAVPLENPPVVTHPQKAALFYNVTDDALTVSENADEYIAPASLLKLLTASVALRYLSPDEVITVGTELELVPPRSSLCLISEGHRLTLYDLLTGMLLASGNDAAYTAAVYTAREVSGKTLSDTKALEYFTSLMNLFARELGMNNSYFVNPDGSDDERQYTTANDLLLLARYALTVPEIREITSTHQKYVVFESGQNITWTNSNKLLDPENKFYCPDAIGLKTGTTDNAGCNLIAAFNKNGKLYIAVVIGCKNDKERYKLVTEYYSSV